MAMPTIIQLTERREVAPAAHVLARAFRDNPVMVALFARATAEDRERLLVPCMKGFVNSVIRYGVAEVVEDRRRVVAASLCFRPTEFPPPLLATVLQAPGPIRAGLRTSLRFARTDLEMRRLHPRHPHWYLWFLGVDPAWQGRGLGSLLLQSLARKADADGAPCYLETEVPGNVRFYARHGYAVDGEETLGAIDVKFWFMSKPAP